MARKFQKKFNPFKDSGNYFGVAFQGLVAILLSLVLSGCAYLGTRQTQPEILFLALDEEGIPQIFRYSDADDITQLTQVTEGVYDFAVAPTGDQLIFTTATDQQSSAIWQMRFGQSDPEMLYDCPNSLCSQPVWAPDGRRLIFQRQANSNSGSLNMPTLWWLDTTDGQVRSLFAEEETLGSAVRFSPNGEWLSYYSPVDEGVYIYNFEAGEVQFFANEVGMPVSWRPDSQKLIVPNLNLVIIHGDEGEDHDQHSHDFQTATHLFMADPQTGELNPISGDFNVEDSVPSWSPDGQKIAFARRPARTAAGRQLWMMRADGSEVTPLTEDFSMNYGPPAWSDDGRYLLYQKIALDNSQEQPGIWLYDIDSGEERLLVEQGVQPQWLR